MAYTKNTWASGDVITAEKLNHMEDGIEGGNSGSREVIVINTHYEGSYVVLEKTFNEIKNYIENGNLVVIKISHQETETFYQSDISFVIYAQHQNNTYTIKATMPSSSQYVVYDYTTADADGYPQRYED